MTDTILVAYGSDDASESALRFAAERAARTGDRLHVLHVQTGDEDGPVTTETIDDVLDGIDVEYVLENLGFETGDAANVSVAKRLIDHVLSDDYAYVVMGNKSKGALEEMLVGSVTEAVLETHAIPVMLVPPED